MSKQTVIDLIAGTLRSGLPHPGDKEKNLPPQSIYFPGMNIRGVPQEVLDHYAREAGLPSPDLPRLIAEAIVNLIETQGDSAIVNKAELGNLREAAGRREAEGAKRCEVGDEVGSGPDADGPVDGAALSAGGQGLQDLARGDELGQHANGDVVI